MAANPIPSSERRLWTFHGGIHIADEKALSNASEITVAPVPKQLVIPLQQHIGASARVLVAVGDRVLKGQCIAAADGYVSAPVHASSSGTVVAIEERPVPHPSGLSALCAVIETDGEDAWAELPDPMTHYAQLDPAEVRERIRWAGVVGMGGASFPTGVKLNPGPDRRIDTLVINGAECEPYITCDDRLMRERASRILEGVRIMRHLLGGPEVLIGIEDNKPEAIAAMRFALGESDLRAGAEVVAIPTLYPSGGEKQLIRILTGKEVPSHGIPAQIGIVCQNVGTAHAVAEAVLDGRPLIARVVTVTGRAITAPRNLEARIGTPAADLIACCDGYREQPRKLVCGGPMMGFELGEQGVPVTKPVNCLLALTTAEAPDPGQALACIRCGRCADACPANLLPQQLYWFARAKDFDHAQDYNLFDCIECGCCAQVCPSHIPLVQYYRYAKTEVWAREQEKRKAEEARERHAAKQARLERQERERQARMRQKKEALAAKAKAESGAGSEAKQAAIAAARARTAAKQQGASEPTDGA
ncbi:electron transporter RnfC [Marichromatium purpuratum 984]|uniref:Ion-translocating oxidoreductase complex subunit C n=1 Tax=Marichromatium purpuratum 984 TaxID=765910 RepID=W0DXC9_MARPU|nr:electron transport complex subunit RsxC [Marichromatium purpuratum]AHF03117.1 electron transporter RnfC [Marichromatium purpuratum 984]